MGIPSHQLQEATDRRESELPVTCGPEGTPPVPQELVGLALTTAEDLVEAFFLQRLPQLPGNPVPDPLYFRHNGIFIPNHLPYAYRGEFHLNSVPLDAQFPSDVIEIIPLGKSQFFSLGFQFPPNPVDPGQGILIALAGGRLPAGRFESLCRRLGHGSPS